MVKKKYTIPSLEELLEAGVHFGHRVRRWNPRMGPYIHTTKSGSHVFDLAQTRERLTEAAEFLEGVADTGGRIIFVGTKKQARAIIRQEAARCGAMFVTERWLGGTLTNFDSIRSKITRLGELEEGLERGKFDRYTKKERLDLEKERAKLERIVGGLQGVKSIPDAVVVVDIKKEKTCVRECLRMGVPTIALVDTNSDPRGIRYTIPGNDDAIKSIALVIKVLADAVEAGQADGSGNRSDKSNGSDKKSEGKE